MNVDRALFLAFAASLSAAAVGCAGSDDGATTGPDEFLTGERQQPYCWSPATESASGSSRDYYVGVIGFDPVADYPSAEGFCISLAWPNGIDFQHPEYQSQTGVFEKCQAYARNFVPFTAYDAFADMKSIAPEASAIEKFSKLYEIDRKIAADRIVCQTEAAGTLCGAHDPECNAIASQLKPEKLPLLQACLDNTGYDAYTCLEGGAELR